jgi:hypothetical protein
MNKINVINEIIVINNLTNQIYEINNDIKATELKIIENNQIDKDKEQNILTTINNNKVKRQIEYVRYNKSYEYKIIVEENIRYLHDLVLVDAYNVQQRISYLQQSIDDIYKYEKYQYKLELQKTIENDEKTLFSIINDMLWYDKYDKLIEEEDKWNKYKEIVILNKEIQRRIDYNNSKLIILNKLYEIDYHDCIIYKQKRDDVHKSIIKINELIDNTRKNIQNIETYIAVCEHRVSNHSQHTPIITSSNQELTSIEYQLKLHKKYIGIFHQSNLPFKLIDSKLLYFNNNVNTIFSKYTKYKFYANKSDNDKMVFNIIYPIDNHNIKLTPDRLSGYERIILQIALSQASLSISNNHKCELLIIDEALDCIDQSKFTDKLPNIIEMIRQYYQTIILISHRDVPKSIVDKNLKITHYPEHRYSTINE